MKLYHKHGKLFNNSYELNQGGLISGCGVDINSIIPSGYNIKNSRMRRQRFFDMEVEGKNYLKMPIIFKGNR